MKSTFLFLVILVSLMTGQVFAQTKKPRAKIKAKPTQTLKKKAVTKKVTTTAAAPTKVVEASKTSFDKFYERLSISYFGVFQSPNFENWDSRRAALSPEFSGGSNQDSYSMFLWNQVNFAYNYGGKMKFNVIPRFTLFLNEAPDQAAGERGNVLLEDALVGFSGVVYSSSTKKFNWWMRPGMRLPTSHGTRSFNNDDFGRLTYGLEFLHSFTYDFTKELLVGLTLQHRMWVFENRYNGSRVRHFTNPYISYALNDTTKIQAYFEHMLENNKRWKSINGKEPVYYDVWQNLMIGVSKDVTSKMNVMPFISAFVNDVPFSMKSVWGGMWISYSIK